MKQIPEGKLIKACKRGSPSAQRELYQRYVKAMYHIALRIVGERTQAEDVVQESFVRAFHQLDRFRGEATLGAWLKRITINTALNKIRRNKKLGFTELEDLEFISEPVAIEPQNKYSVEDIHRGIQELPEGSRVVLSLHLLEGYQHKEISQILGITESTSKSQYHRAKKLLQNILVKHKNKTHA